MSIQLGPIAMLGSGETSLAGRRIFEAVAEKLNRPVRVALLETPAGFELNSTQVTGRVGEFLQKRLRNYDLIVRSIPARKRGTPYSPDDPEILEWLSSANLIFMGPGSPTYAVRQLQDSLAWDLVRARHRQGAALVFASAAMIAVGKFALPVYEIFKVGEDVRAVPGLDLFGDFGMALSFIPHWNNLDGGEGLDTSRCFIGLERFNQWCADLPEEHVTLGLDEHTGLLIDFQAGVCRISGVGSATLVGGGELKTYPSNGEFPIGELGPFELGHEGNIRPEAWKMLDNPSGHVETKQIPNEIQMLLKERQQARDRYDWQLSDEIRSEIVARGWLVEDTQEGSRLKPGTNVQ